MFGVQCNIEKGISDVEVESRVDEATNNDGDDAMDDDKDYVPLSPTQPSALK